MISPVWRGRDEELRPFGNIKASDSANLDMIAEVFRVQGMFIFIQITREPTKTSWNNLEDHSSGED